MGRISRRTSPQSGEKSCSFRPVAVDRESAKSLCFPTSPAPIFCSNVVLLFRVVSRDSVTTCWAFHQASARRRRRRPGKVLRRPGQLYTTALLGRRCRSRPSCNTEACVVQPSRGVQKGRNCEDKTPPPRGILALHSIRLQLKMAKQSPPF